MTPVEGLAYQQFEKDMGSKCAADISGAMERNYSLLDDARQKFIVGTFGATVAIAWAAAALNEMLGPDVTPEECVDALFDKLRPMVVSNITEMRA